MRCTPQIRRLVRGCPLLYRRSPIREIRPELVAEGVEEKELPTTACKGAKRKEA